MTASLGSVNEGQVEPTTGDSHGLETRSYFEGAVTKRPLLDKTLKDLTAIVDKKGVTAGELADVIYELSFRRSAGAKRLLARLTGSAGTSKQPTLQGSKPKSAKQGRAKAASASVEDSFVPSEVLETGPEARDAIERLKVLRETYTEGAELLARWGATTALPDDILRLLFGAWAKVVTDQPDEFGRSRATLQRDMERWESLSAGILNEGEDE